MVMYANEVETKRKIKITRDKKLLQHRHSQDIIRSYARQSPKNFAYEATHIHVKFILVAL